MINSMVNKFRCHQCGGIFSMMWGTTCNKCRKENENNEALLNEIKLLREQLAKTQTK